MNDKKMMVRLSQEVIDSLMGWPQSGYIPLIKGSYRPPSTHKRLYKPGKKFRSINSLAQWVEWGGYVFFRGKSYHPGWLRGFQFGYILWNLKAGNIRQADRLPEKNVMIKIPSNKHSKDMVFVKVGGMNYPLPRDKWLTVPESVMIVLQSQRKAVRI